MDLNSERQLVEAAQNGHLESFGALYERYHGTMLALAYSMLNDRELAEDTAQEVFATACREIGKLKSKEKTSRNLTGRADWSGLFYAQGQQEITRLNMV